MVIHKLVKGYLLNNKTLKDAFAINILYLAYEFIRHIFLSGFRYYKVSHFLKFKSSDTLVILGAGASINELSDQQLENLGSFDVAGLSYSCILPVKQTFYFYESPSFNEKESIEEHANKILPLILEYNRKGKLTHLIWKNSENKVLNNYSDFTAFVCPNVCSILTDNLNVIRNILNFYNKYGLNKFFLLQKRGSVVALIQFAILSKYKKIVFVGVDLNESNYFFQNNAKYTSHDFTDPYLLDNTPKSNVHRTNDRALGIPIIEVLRVIFEEETSVQFYVVSENSALKKYLPLWDWRTT